MNTGEKRMYLVENNHPAIIDRATWQKAQNKRLARIDKYLNKQKNGDNKKLSFSLSIYAHFVQCSKCKAYYTYKVNKSWANKMLICRSNKVNKKCQSESFFCEVFDNILIQLINTVLNNKAKLIEEIKKNLSIKDRLDKVKLKLLKVENEMDDLKLKLNDLQKYQDEFFQKVMLEIETKIKALIIKKVNLENEIATTFNLDIYISQIKSLLKIKDSINSLVEFPFKQLFTKAIMLSRNRIIFVIGEIHDDEVITNFDDCIFKDSYTWYIRKQEFTTEYGIIIK